MAERTYRDLEAAGYSRSRVRDKAAKSHHGTRNLLLDPVALEILTDTNAKVGSPRCTCSPAAPADPCGRTTSPAGSTHSPSPPGSAPIGPHQIWHLLASSLLDAGYGIHEVAERLGHDPGTLMRYYIRVNATRGREATAHIAGPMSTTRS